MMKPVFPFFFGWLPTCLLLYVAYRNYPWWTDPFGKYVAAAVGLLITVGITAIAVMAGESLSKIIGESARQVWHECWRAGMVSMRNVDGPDGRLGGGIFMVVGSVGTSETYFYYTQAADGGLKPHKWTPDNDTTIYEEDRQDGEVVQFNSQFKSRGVQWFGTTNSRLRMDFHIPRGSVQRNFALK